MRSTEVPGDRDLTSRAVIRNAALRLFAERGADSVTLREVAAEAGVSAALVVHHFGGKDGLRAAVDDHAAAVFDTMLAALDGQPGDALAAEGASSLSEDFAQAVPPDSPLPAYLRRMLLTGGARDLFGRWFALSKQVLSHLIDAGFVEATEDLDGLAAFLLANDLALILLRDQLAGVLGEDPLGRTGLERWTHIANQAYRSGIFRMPDDPDSPSTTGKESL